MENNFITILNYPGSKKRLLNFIDNTIYNLLSPGSIVLDIFSGTSSVAYSLKDKYNVYSNDAEVYCYTIGKALLGNNRFVFDSIKDKFMCVYQKNKTYLQKVFFEYQKESEMVASKNDSIALSIDDPADRPLVSDGAISQVEHILRNINATIQEDQHLSIELKTDYLVLTDGLYHAMESRDLRTIKIIFIGFKHALANYKPCAKKAKDVEACLKLYMLI